MQHRLPLGTKVAFAGDPHVYVTADYQTVLACPEDCEDDHDCFPEPHICVSYTITTSKPLRELEMVFDAPNSFGRKPSKEELSLKE